MLYEVITAAAAGVVISVNCILTLLICGFCSRNLQIWGADIGAIKKKNSEKCFVLMQGKWCFLFHLKFQFKHLFSNT